MAELKTTISSLEAKKLNQSTIRNLKLAILHTVPDKKFPHRSITQKELCDDRSKPHNFNKFVKCL